MNITSNNDLTQTLTIVLFCIAGKEFKKSPPKGVLFEGKLERLLVVPDRELDDINVPRGLMRLSLWREFVKIPQV